MVKNNLLQPFQSAYRSNSSTETALLKVKSDIMSALDNQQAVFLVLLDLSAAFDTIDHSILLNRMSNVFGITGSVQKWFHSYLTDRTCKVKIATRFFWPSSPWFWFTQPGLGHWTSSLLILYSSPCWHHKKLMITLNFIATPMILNCILPVILVSLMILTKALSTLTACILDIKKWMAFNMLQT